jgi:Arc/MetJ family transcription regulator
MRRSRARFTYYTRKAGKELALICASNDVSICALEALPMRTTVVLDDQLLAKARDYTGIEEKSVLLREALKALVEREAARRLARLGGSDPDFEAAPRRRSAL